MICNVITYFLQGVGVPATLPDVVPSDLPVTGSGPHEWNYDCTSLWHNERKLSSDLPDLYNLNPQQRVRLLLPAIGDLHVFIDLKR